MEVLLCRVVAYAATLCLLKKLQEGRLLRRSFLDYGVYTLLVFGCCDSSGSRERVVDLLSMLVIPGNLQVLVFIKGN